MQYLTTRDVSVRTGLSVSWFKQARLRGDGPPYIKTGRSVRYDPNDVARWMDGHRVVPQIAAEA